MADTRLTVIPERFYAGTSSGRRREQGKLRLPRSSLTAPLPYRRPVWRWPVAPA